MGPLSSWKFARMRDVVVAFKTLLSDVCAGLIVCSLLD